MFLQVAVKISENLLRQLLQFVSVLLSQNLWNKHGLLQAMQGVGTSVDRLQAEYAEGQAQNHILVGA